MHKETKVWAPIRIVIASFLMGPVFAQDTPWDQLMEAGRAALEQRRFDEAAKNLKAALEEAEGFGPSDPRLVTTLRSLEEVYQRQGVRISQVPIKKRIVEIREGQLGYSHPDLVPALLELAWLYQELQKPAEALPLLRRVLEIRETVLGPNDAQALESVNELGWAYLQLQRFPEAEEMFRRSLLAHESAPGIDSEVIARDLKSLSALYLNQGRRDDAEALSRQALEVQDQDAEKNPGMVGDTAWQLGAFYWAHRRFAEAEPLLLRALEIEEKTLGRKHPNLLARFQEMANFYRIQGREGEADSYIRRALALAAQPGEGQPSAPDDVETVHRLVNSGSLYMSQGKHAEAEKLYRQALELDRQAGRSEYPMDAAHLHNLGLATCAEGKYAEAVSYFQQAIEMTEKAEGASHPRVAESLLPLARRHAQTGHNAAAEAVYQQAIQLADKAGERPPFALLQALGQYSLFLRRTNRPADAERIQSRIDALGGKLTQASPHPQPTLTPHGGGSATTYVYNALGQRVEKHPGTAYTELVYDAFGSPIGSHNRTTWATYFVPFGGRTLVRYQDNKTYFMHPNHLESATFVTDQTGTPVEKTLYYPWGQTWASAGPYVYTSFAGMYPADGETGNDPTLFRMYNPRLYRWLSPDPLAGDILNPQSLNRYAYVLNNPVNLIDPLGLDPPQGPPPHPGCGDDPTIQCVYQRYHWSIPGYFGAGTVCYIDGVRDSCDRAFSLVESGAAFPVPPEDQGWRPTTNQRDCPGCFVNGQDVLWDPENQATWQGTIWVVSLTIDSDWFQRRLSPNNMRKTPPKPTVSSPGHPSYKWFDFVKCTVSENMMNLFGGDQAVMSLGLPIGTAVAATAQRWEFAIPAATATAIHYSNAFLKSNAACTQEVYGQVP